MKVILDTELISAIGTLALGLGLTVLAYGVALVLFRRSGQSPLVNPVLLGVCLVMLVLQAGGVSYATYFDGARVLHFLLGTATVALAVPLYHQLQHLRASLIPILLSVFVGSLTAAVSALVIASSLGASELTLLSLAPKSTTTPVAMGIAAKLGGLPSLTAAAVILTGIFGAIFGLGILRLAGIKSQQAKGISLGIAAHGVGTARALQINPTLGAYSGLAMGLAAMMTSALVPVLWLLLRPLLV